MGFDNDDFNVQDELDNVLSNLGSTPTKNSESRDEGNKESDNDDEAFEFEDFEQSFEMENFSDSAEDDEFVDDDNFSDGATFDLKDGFDDFASEEDSGFDNDDNLEEEQGNQFNLSKIAEDMVDSVLEEKDSIESSLSQQQTNVQKLIKWSTTNVKNISNYEEELNLLNNNEIVTVLKTAKTNIISNQLADGKELHLLSFIDNINIDIDKMILKMHKYYLICIAVGLIQKKILLEKQVFLNHQYIKSEIKKLQDFKNFLLDYTAKQSELQAISDINEYFEQIRKTIGAVKK